tara:strand:- start:68 stop:637 length:570 start_codon:yes stop_codon:yes gene_type:complete
MRFAQALMFSLFAVVLANGCDSSKTGDEVETGLGQHADHQHSHDHEGHDHEGHDHGSHDHDAGPHGGHVLELGGHEYHAEWVRDDELSKITVYLWDNKIEEEVFASSEVVISVTINEKTEQYKLEPEISTNDDSAMASQFTSSDASLLTALKIGEGLEIRLEVEIGGTDFDVKIEHHEDAHGHHGHVHE